MNIIDEGDMKEINRVYLVLESSEARELLDSLVILLSSPDSSRHEHVNDFSFRREITIKISKTA